MKKLSFLLLLIFSFGLQSCMVAVIMITSERLALNPKVLNQLKNEKVIISTIEVPKKANEEEKEAINAFNNLAVDLLKKHWNYCEIYDVMPIEEAEKFARKNRGYHILFIGNTGYELVSSNGQYVRGVGDYSSLGIELIYFTNALSTKPAAFEMPFTKEKSFFNEISGYATILAFQDMLKQIETKKIGAQQYFARNNKRNTSELGNKKLLFPEYMVNKEIGEKGIRDYYKYDIEFCSKEKYNEAILQSVEGYIIPLYSSVPVGKTWYKQIIFYDSETWECYVALRLPSRKRISNIDIFNSKDYNEFLKLDKKTWKQIAKGLKSI